MLQVSDFEVESRLHFDNPWWQSGQMVSEDLHLLPRRAYFPAFLSRVRETDVRRAVILLGPRRVGKTVMLHQTIQQLLTQGVPGNHIVFLSLETPIYTGMGLEKLLQYFMRLHGHTTESTLWIFFDEIQYLKDWEVHLKSLVDSYRRIRFVASGSAAAALRMKSQESGAGRFSKFMLPPLTFAEFVQFSGKSHLVESMEELPGQAPRYEAPDIDALNQAFIDYLNYGGYPEAVMQPSVRANPGQYLRADIIDKVLLRDLPSLYGIQSIQELNRFFNMLAYNTGQELSPSGLSKASGVDVVTLRKYLEYLEAAFLIQRIYRIDNNAKRFQRDRTFKVYLTNTSMRAALFAPVEDGSEALGALAETAVFSQWLHQDDWVEQLHYARWRDGRTDREVDMVLLERGTQKPRFAVEVKWSDRAFDDRREIAGLLDFYANNQIVRMPLVTTKTKSGIQNIDNVSVEFMPVSLHCYTVSRNLLRWNLL